MSGAQVVRIVAGVLALGVLGVMIFALVSYILTLSRALKKCSVTSLTLQPGTLWLLLIPIVNLVWHFFVVIGMAKTLGNEFRARNMPNVEQEPAKGIGIGMCVCGACSWIPILGIAADLAFLVLWIMYWSKIAGYSRMLDDQLAVIAPAQ
jgi:hypothetical protein